MFKTRIINYNITYKIKKLEDYIKKKQDLNIDLTLMIFIKIIYHN